MLMTTCMPYLDANSVETCFDIEADCIFVKDRYLSETGLIENAAQSSAAIVAQSYAFDLEQDRQIGEAIAYISAIKKVAVFSLPKVGERLRTKGNLLSRYDEEHFSLCTIASETFRKEELIVACTFNFLVHGIHH